MRSCAGRTLVSKARLGTIDAAYLDKLCESVSNPNHIWMGMTLRRVLSLISDGDRQNGEALREYL